jgi:predicted nucleotidyltransferase component of viral defense system
VKISRERLLRESEATGFRPEVLEKVIHLLSLMTGFSRHPFLQERVALKGGTALNLFVLDLPRLSVDIDLNYVRATDVATMQAERPLVEEALAAVCSREGLTVARPPGDEHAGGRFSLRYESALGGGASLKLDVNYMFRQPLWPIQRMDSHALWTTRALDIPVMDIHELAAGKFAALLARHASRDLFDAHRLLTTQKFQADRLRLAFVVYGGLNRKDWRTVTAADVGFSPGELQNELIPVLRRAATKDLPASVSQLVDEVRDKLEIVLPFSGAEARFLDRLLDEGIIEPALIADDEGLSERIRNHPGLLWKAANVRAHRQAKTKPARKRTHE